MVGCQGKSAPYQIYEHLEEAVRLESGFAEQQEEISKLEKEEQEIYQAISELDEQEEINELADQAIDNIKERQERVKLEQESIHKAKEEFERIKPLINDLGEDQAKEKANEMYMVMKDRYEIYQDLYTLYVSSLKEEKTLYTSLQREDYTQEEYREQIELINENYKQAIDVNDQFNEATLLYNSLKKEFYKAADMDVVYEEE